MRKLEAPSIHMPEGFSLWADNSTGKLTLYAVPDAGGESISFTALSQLRRWIALRNDERAVQQGKPTFREKVMQMAADDQASAELCERMIAYHYGE